MTGANEMGTLAHTLRYKSNRISKSVQADGTNINLIDTDAPLHKLPGHEV